MVRPTPGTTLDDILIGVDATALHPVGLSGFGLVRVNTARQAAVVTKLRADTRVDAIYPNGRTEGAANGSGRHRFLQWHLNDIGDPMHHTQDFSNITVAVLDSGANYATRIEDGQYYRRVSTLRYVSVQSPYDFINSDSWPLDDHQHGTHIATTVLGDGAVMGSAPGATLMPIKILDSANSGTEWELVEGIYWAMTHGADVANMSLSFSPDYLPSAALKVALTVASDSGVVLVGAAGNHLADEVTWPAAHPRVIAVGAHTPVSPTAQAPAWYSNLGTAVDVMAPGGDTSANLNGDQWGDGVLAHTTRQNQPQYTRYFFMAGTSQAAAIASGVVVQLLNAGVQPEDIRAHLQLGANAMPQSFTTGEGAGQLQSAGALAAQPSTAAPHSAHIGMLPYLKAAGTDVIPTVNMMALDEDGLPLVNVEILVTALGNVSDTWLSCTTDATGQCRVYSNPVSDSTDVAVMFRADAVVVDDAWTLSPMAMMHESSAFEELVAALEAHSDLAGLPLSVAWTAGNDSELGDIAGGYSVVDTGSGLASLPVGMVFNLRMLLNLPRTLHTVDLQGVSVEVESIQLGGSGLASLPLGLRYAKFGFVSGAGLASLPLGVHPHSVFVRNPTGRPVWLDRPLGAFAPTANTALSTRLSAGGWQASGYPGASFATAASGVTVASSASTGSNRTVGELYDPYEPLD
jgi:hypothetical protein